MQELASRRGGGGCVWVTAGSEWVVVAEPCHTRNGTRRVHSPAYSASSFSVGTDFRLLMAFSAWAMGNVQWAMRARKRSDVLSDGGDETEGLRRLTGLRSIVAAVMCPSCSTEPSQRT